MTSSDFQAWTAAGQSRIEAFLQKVLPSPDIAPQRLHAAMRYAVLGAGKRVRPLLAYAAGELSQADPERVTVAGDNPHRQVFTTRCESSRDCWSTAMDRVHPIGIQVIRKP